jgi:hypothetical protein
MTEPYHEFASTLADLRAAREAYHACFATSEKGEYTHPVSVAYREEMQAAWKALQKQQGTRRRFDWEQACTAFPEIEAKWREAGANLVTPLLQAIKDAEARLIALAETLPLPESDEWVLLGSCSGSEYHTQGFGANSYAKASASLILPKAEYYGLTVELRESQRERGEYYANGQYDVYARTTELGREILDRKPEPPFRDVAKRLLQQSRNLRVYYPFLPHGWEEANGLDFWGNEIAPRAAA